MPAELRAFCRGVSTLRVPQGGIIIACQRLIRRCGVLLKRHSSIVRLQGHPCSQAFNAVSSSTLSFQEGAKDKRQCPRSSFFIALMLRSMIVNSLMMMTFIARGTMPRPLPRKCSATAPPPAVLPTQLMLQYRDAWCERASAAGGLPRDPQPGLPFYTSPAPAQFKAPRQCPVVILLCSATTGWQWFETPSSVDCDIRIPVCHSPVS